MPGAEQDDDPEDTVGTTPEEGTARPTDGPAGSPVAPEEPSIPEDKVTQVKHSDFKRIKEEARARGRQQALSELDTAAKAVGFASHSDALKALAELNKKPPAPPAAPQPKPEGAPAMSTKPVNQPKPTDTERQRMDSLRLADERSQMRKQWRAEERRRRELEQQLDAKEAEMALREELYRAGVRDVDYALRLLTRELEGKSEEEIAAYNRVDFYSGLKKDKPYLFGETVAPATTGTSGAKQDGVQPITPAPGGAAAEEAGKQVFDARSAKPQAVADRLRALGLNPHM